MLSLSRIVEDATFFEWLKHNVKGSTNTTSRLTQSDLEFIRQGGYWDSSEADRIRDFIETYCIQSKHPFFGMPVELMQYQWKLIRNLYSWRNADSSRRYRELILFVPKSNGKSTLISCLCLYTMLAIEGSLTLVMATDIEQANIVFGESAMMCELSPELEEVTWVRRSRRTIQHDGNKSFIKMLSSIPSGKSGFRADLWVADELCEHKEVYARTTIDLLENATASKPSALKVVISTAHFKQEGNVGFEHFKKAKDIINGNIIETQTYAVVYCVDDDDKWDDVEALKKANPACGKVFNERNLLDDLEKVKNDSVGQNRFRTLRANQFVGISEFVQAYTINKQSIKLDNNLLKSLPCCITVDASKQWDLTAVSFIWKDGLRYYAKNHYFQCQSMNYRKCLLDGVPYDRWAREGNLHLTLGDTISYEEVRQVIEEEARKYKVAAIYYDAYNFEESRRLLEKATKLECVQVVQNAASMGEPTSVLYKQLLDGHFFMEDNPITKWCYGNIKLTKYGGNTMMIDKYKNTKRIDGVTAHVLGVKAWMETEVPVKINWKPIVY